MTPDVGEAEKLGRRRSEGYEGYREGQQGKIEAIEAVREENIKKISSLVGLLESIHEELKILSMCAPRQ